MKTIRKILSIALCLALVMSYVPLVSLTALGAEGVSYIDASGETQICTEYTSLTSYQMTSGWYVLDSDITFSGEVYADGDVHLILKDGCTLNAKKGGINVSSGGNLVIYGQSNNTGTIYATGSYNSAGIGDDYNNRSTGYQSITINGGTIIAKGYDNGAGIGSANGLSGSGYSGTITVNGGNVTATGGRNAAGIGGGRYLSISVIVNGGNITATGGSGAAGIGGGIRGVCSNTYINGGYITATGGSGAAGIGNGSDIDKGWSAVTVNGGIVFANGGSGASGIGVNDVGFISVININSGLVIDNNLGTLYSDVTIDRNVTLGSDQTLTIPSGKTLTVGEGKTLTNDGTIINNGTLINNGTFNENNNFVNNGVFTNNWIYNCNHKMVDGICTKCGAYKEPTQNEEGYYQIAEAGHLFWLAQKINDRTITKFNAILTADIVIPDDKEWVPIGLPDGMENSSVFDGNGYSITLNQSNGLFRDFNYSVFRNVVLYGTVTANTTNSVGAVVGSAYRTTIQNVISYVDVTNSGGNAGGLAGYFGGKHGGGMSSLISNCAVYADISGTNAGGFVGEAWNGTQYFDIANCTYMGDVTGTNVGAIVGYQNTDTNTCVFTNIYWCEADDIGFYGKRDTANQIYTNTMAKTPEQFASGEVAYLLQQGNTEQVWGQDNNQAGATPVFDSTGLYKVVTVAETGNYSVANVGDTNGDGTVDVIDYQALVNTILADNHEQLESASYDDIVKCDLDGDGYLDVLDASLMHLLINGHKTVDVYAVGDYDLNGEAFEEADVFAMAEAMGKPENLATYQKYTCDLNADGKVDYDDLNILTTMFPIYFVGEE